MKGKGDGKERQRKGRIDKEKDGGEGDKSWVGKEKDREGEGDEVGSQIKSKGGKVQEREGKGAEQKRETG